MKNCTLPNGIACNLNLSYFDFRKPRQNSGPFIALRVSTLGAQFYCNYHHSILTNFIYVFHIRNTSLSSCFEDPPNPMDFLIFSKGLSTEGHLLATLQMKLKDLDEEVKATMAADKLVDPRLLMVTTWGDLLISKKTTLKNEKLG